MFGILRLMPLSIFLGTPRSYSFLMFVIPLIGSQLGSRQSENLQMLNVVCGISPCFRSLCSTRTHTSSCCTHESHGKSDGLRPAAFSSCPGNHREMCPQTPPKKNGDRCRFPAGRPRQISVKTQVQHRLRPWLKPCKVNNYSDMYNMHIFE